MRQSGERNLVSPDSNLILVMLAAFADMEHAPLVERTQAERKRNGSQDPRQAA